MVDDLLILHGGPGVPNRHGIAAKHMDLTGDFTVVAWDQRGTGGSYFGCDPASLTLDQLVSDCIELMGYLCSLLGKKPMLLGACITYVLLYCAIYNYNVVINIIGGPAFAILIGLVIAFPIAITNIIPASIFADLAQYDSIMTGQNRAGMFFAARNFANKLCQAVVVIACALLLGTGADGTGATTSTGIRQTALVAMIFVALSVVIYWFYDDKKIVQTIREHAN